MYTEFYNLKEKPFNVTPNTRYLYLGEIHKEAFALLQYGVIERKGFIVLTGEVGTGKTTMINALLESLEDDVRYVYISNPLFSVNDFLEYVAFSAFKRKIHYKTKTDFLIQFESFLKEQIQNQKTFLLIIDEAQKLSVELLEEIRLLSNMETADEKLINIFLIGQPELSETLKRPECRPLLQRINVRYNINTLDLDEVTNYLNTRLEIAGVDDLNKIFTKKAVKEIYRLSKGYPRIINILADNALLAGYSRGEKIITPEIITECYKDLQFEDSFFKQEKSTDYAVPNSIEKPIKRIIISWQQILVIMLFIILTAVITYLAIINKNLKDDITLKKEEISFSVIPEKKDVLARETVDEEITGSISRWHEVIESKRK